MPARNLFSSLSSTTPPYSNPNSKSLTTILASRINFDSASSKRKGATSSDNFSNWLSGIFHVVSIFPYVLKYLNLLIMCYWWSMNEPGMWMQFHLTPSTISLNASSSITVTPSFSAFANLDPGSSPATT